MKAVGSMAVGGLLIGMFGVMPVFIGAGLISVAAGLGGLLVREVRDA